MKRIPNVSSLALPLMQGDSLLPAEVLEASTDADCLRADAAGRRA
ncbi:hypothetical protein [Luteimonas sp. 3794]|nr:hypothetical protein [Luteimonas sp. 3794]MDR6990497.1 hypothetical protein [Luteimonas sp. 3794]